MTIARPRNICGIFLLNIGLLFSGFLNFAQEKAPYADARAVLEPLAELIEEFVMKMNEAETPDSVAEILDTFAESMKTMVPKINEISKKYPEIKNEDTHPEALKSLLQRIEKDFGAMMKAYTKVMENIETPAVKTADDKYKAIMKGLK